MTVLCQSIKSGVVNLKPMGAGQGRGLEQVTVNEVAVGRGCFWMNGLAPFHLSLIGYMIFLLKLWMVSLPLASYSGNCPSLLVLCSSKRKQMLSQYSSYRFSQPFILKFPPFPMTFPKINQPLGVNFCPLAPAPPPLHFPYQLSKLLTYLVFILSALQGTKRKPH